MTAEGVVLTESVMVHMLADLDQIITEMELSPQTRSIADWAHMLRHAVKGSDYARQPKPDYPPNVTCVCGDLIHPDQPFVSVEADGGLFHWNADGGGHRADARVS